MTTSGTQSSGIAASESVVAVDEVADRRVDVAQEMRQVEAGRLGDRTDGLGRGPRKCVEGEYEGDPEEEERTADGAHRPSGGDVGGGFPGQRQERAAAEGEADDADRR